ncbi:hypothetical protein NKH45_28675 [Mesorhizobium sp. M1156]|uniref:hypothetical protein n=1 Tax=Mesorhizobium sp. M1156 TaxID=2957064 RepID=UPI00333E17F9
MQANKARLGIASRALMDHSFEAKGGDGLMPLAISFVGKTFDSDPVASRKLVERLIEPQRMAEHASGDMHWLAQEVGRISDVNADLVVSIYEAVFKHIIEDDTPTQLGNSQILPLMSNRRQDFKMAQWALKEKFPAFAKKHPLAAASAAVKVAGAYRDSEHPLTEPEKTLTVRVGDVEAKLRADLSSIWAAQHRAQYSDDAHEIVDSFVDAMRAVPDDDAVTLAERVIATNELAWLWARLFMVAGQRGGALAAMLWPWATQLGFLQLADTMKDAIDLVAAGYTERSDVERVDLEKRVFAAAFPHSSNPDAAKLRFQRRVFGAIGLDSLVTQEAKRIVEAAIAEKKEVPNEPMHRIDAAEWIDTDDFDWLREKGVDTNSAENIPILKAIRACESRDRQERNERSPSQRVSDAKVLYERLSNPLAHTHPLVLAHGWGGLSRAIESVTHESETAQALAAEERSFVQDVISNASSAASSAPAENAEIGNRSRANLAGAAMNMARLDAAIAVRLKPSIVAFAADPSPDVRHDIAWRLHYLWNVDRELCSKLVDQFSATEQDARVLLGVVDFLVRAANAEPELVGRITQKLLSRTDVLDDDNHRGLREGLGSLVFCLWIRHGQADARAALDRWLANRVESKVELGKGAFSIREGLVLGYDKDASIENVTRKRCQKLAFEIIDVTARGIEAFVALSADDRTDEVQVDASNDAALLDQMASQFFFAVGSTEIREGKEPRALGNPLEQRRFIADNLITLMRVGDAGTPRTIHYLLQLLEFLMPSDPAAVFDLVSHALLKAGKLHGYQFESLGADLFAKMIGRVVADHREIFDDPGRRLSLVKVLEVFVDAGWPAARRLLYRLPEALR